MHDDVLVCEISGKRPGSTLNRPTEAYDLGDYRHIIISNDHEGYETDWEIVDVPSEYREWYSENVKQSDKLWLAQMNRSYALRMARELGYRYCIQLDDNINSLEIAYQLPESEHVSRVYRTKSSGKYNGMAVSFIEMLCTVLENSNAGMAGCDMMNDGLGGFFLRERFVYSFLALDVERCFFPFQGDFEDDIEYRLKLAQQGVPTIEVVPLRYGKVPASNKNDVTGCRQAYSEVGVGRGDNMRRLYGSVYSCGTSLKNTTTSRVKKKAPTFKHRLRPFEIGFQIRNMDAINAKMAEILERHASKEIVDAIYRAR